MEKITHEEFIKLLEATKNNKLKIPLLKEIFKNPQNLDLFSYYFFPHACTSKIPSFHYEIYEWLFEEGDGALAAPRGHAKSTLVGLIFLVFCVVNKLEKYIVYMSQSFSKTVQFIEPLMQEFSGNERLRMVYGDLTPSKEKDDQGKFRQDIIDINKIRIQAASFEKNIRGFKYQNQRPTLILLDDIEDDQRVLNPELRMKDHYKLDKIVIPSLDPSVGKIKMIGTILHWDSLLIKKIRLYNGKIYKACNKNFENVLWPSYWNSKRLKQKYCSIGSVAFSSEFLNNPIENEASLIKGEWIKACFNDKTTLNKNVKGEQKLLGCDFAFGDRATNDKSAYVGVVNNNEKYLISEIITYKGLTIIEQFEELQQIYNAGGYDEVVMEENSIKSLSKDLNNYDFQYYLIWTGAADPAGKLKSSTEFESKRHSVGKKSMILRLATQFENGNISIPYMTDDDKVKAHQLMDELMTFALDDGKLVEVGIHADIPIGLAMALERMNSGGFVFV